VFVSAVRNVALLAAAPLLTAGPLLALTPAPALAGGSPAAAASTVIDPAPVADLPALTEPVPIARLMSQVVTKTNQVRDANGCDQLDVDQELIVASERQSGYMAQTHRFSHIGWGGSTFVTRARMAGYRQPAGENIAWGYSTAEQVMDAWMASPSHRTNILNCDTKSIGTGVSYSENGTPYYTQVFGWQ